MVGKIIIGIVIIGLLAGGYFYWQSTQSKSSSSDEMTETTITEEPPTPTEEQVDKGAYNIQVLNGAGIEGEAGKVKDLLEGEDFTVSDTGNADNYDYTETVIQAGSDVSAAWIDSLKSVLKKSYTVQSRVEDLDQTDGVTVIVGSLDENGDSMIPEEEATPTPEETTDQEENTPTPTEEVTETPTPSPTP